MKVWYPGPSVDAAAAGEAQVHSRLGTIRPGWNELPEGDDVRGALEAGLVTLAAPGVPAVAPKVEAVESAEAAVEAEPAEWKPEGRGRSHRRYEEKE